MKLLFNNQAFCFEKEKKLFKKFGVLFFMSTSGILAQDVVQDSIKSKEIALDEVLVSAIRVDSKSPVTFTNLRYEDFEKRNLGQDIPIMMNFLPSVVTTTDAGAGIGYTGIRVRGSDATRVNVTINGIPYNDAESQGTFWVNMPDFASSTGSMQLQRGVGTSTNGAGAFGASLNLATDTYSKEASGEIANSIGSFNTRKHTVKFSTGLMNDQFEIAGRLSNIRSDGYIDRASADLKSYFLQGTFVGKTGLVKALVFGGKEITYQAWYGLEDEDLLRDNRTFNVAGMYFDANGNMQFYDNEVDNYQQDHFQLHWNEKWSEKWSTNLAFHRTLGKGFFEQYREDESFEDYGYAPINVNGETIETTDLIRRRWLDNDFFGTTFSATYKNENFDLILGGAANRYIGDHFGEVIWAQFAQGNIRDRYYEDQSTKDDVNFFGKINYNLTKKLSLFGDLQVRYVNYTANGVETGLVDDTFRFFNPKAGLTYQFNAEQNLYFSFGRANREPNRNDYESGNPVPERLDDFELGFRYAKKDLKFNANLYYMRYKNQLVLTGALNDVGAPLRANSGKSYRLGLELDGSLNIDDIVTIEQNVTISDNRNLDFVFERDGVLNNLGNTNIAFSPNLIAANQINVKLWENISTEFLSKYVGEQYMGNIDSERSKLDAYFINDYLISYQYDNVGMFESIQLNLMVNNIFDVKYISNGYIYTFDDDFSNPGTVTTIEGAGFYPQATRNFLLGCTLKF